MSGGIAWRMLQQFNRGVTRLFEVLCATAIFVVVVSVIYQVVSRYFGLQLKVLFGGAPWSEEIALFSFVWAAILGNALGVREDTHLLADILPETLGPTGDRVMASMGHLVNLILGVVFLVWGYSYADQAWTRYSQVLSYPMFFMFASLPFTAVGILTFVTERFIQTWSRP